MFTRRGNNIYQMLDSMNCHSELEPQGSSERFLDLHLEDIYMYLKEIQLDEMGGCCDKSSNKRELVQGGVRDGHVVMLGRANTPFPHNSYGEWSGDNYKIYGGDKVMYESKRVPEAVRREIGSGNFRNEGMWAKITFKSNDANIDQYFT